MKPTTRDEVKGLSYINVRDADRVLQANINGYNRRLEETMVSTPNGDLQRQNKVCGLCEVFKDKHGNEMNCKICPLGPKDYECQNYFERCTHGYANGYIQSGKWFEASRQELMDRREFLLKKYAQSGYSIIDR